MYLGVHTPLDVSVAFVTAAALVLALWPLMKRPDTERRLLPMLLGAVALCAAAYLVYVTAYPFPGGRRRGQPGLRHQERLFPRGRGAGPHRRVVRGRALDPL
jgi:hypothetical protein